MDAKNTSSSLDSMVSAFNSQIDDSVTDLSSVAAALKAMELQVQTIKEHLCEETLAIPKAKKLIDASLNQQKKLQSMSVYAPSHIIERFSTLNLEGKNCYLSILAFILLPETSKQDACYGILKLEEEPVPPPKEKKGCASPPLWFITDHELDSLSLFAAKKSNLDFHDNVNLVNTNNVFVKGEYYVENIDEMRKEWVGHLVSFLSNRLSVAPTYHKIINCRNRPLQFGAHRGALAIHRLN
ncbi:hypothetical protein UlMin_000947 [Ulmus minor]